MSNWWEKAPFQSDAAEGRAMLERPDPRFAPPPASLPPAVDNDSWWKMAPVERTAGERTGRLATAVPQGINTGLYKAATFLPDMSGYLARLIGLVPKDAPLPSEMIHDAGRAARDKFGVTYTPNIVPETKGERIAFNVGDAIGQTAATVIPGGIVARTAAPAVGGTRVAIPTYGQTVAETLAANPGMQVTANAAGNVTADLTGNPYLGLAATFAVPAAANTVMRIPFAAPARTGAEAERRALLADAQKEGIPVSFGKIVNSRPAQFFESVTQRLPFVGGQQATMNEQAKTAFDKAAFNKIPEVAGENINVATRGNLEWVGARIGRTFNQLEDATTIRIDPRSGTDIVQAKADFSQQLHSQMPKSLTDKLDELATAADALKPAPAPDPGVQSLDKYPSTDVAVSLLRPQPPPLAGPPVLIDGTTYKDIRRKLSVQLDDATGTDRLAIGKMIDALDGAVERSLPKDMVKDWQDARTSWRRFTMIRDATDARHDARTDQGNIPPGSLAARAGTDRDMERLAAIGTSFVDDKVPDSGAATRLFLQNMMGLGAGGVGAVTYPMTTTAMAGGGYLANLLMNNPFTRAGLIKRFQNPRESVATPGLYATLAAQQASQQSR